METPVPDEVACKGTRDWPHGPPHRLLEAGVYFVTARTAGQVPILDSPQMKDWFQETLLSLAEKYGWRLEAWAVLSNHYHLVGHSPAADSGGAGSLGNFLRHLHSVTTREFNRRMGREGGTRLWQNFRETHLTLQRGYLARLNYVHQNAVHHGLVERASDYRWCSALAFKESVTPAWCRTVASFRFDEIARGDGE
ncbi:hypothetical protein FEM03_13770 [Phragmitibacter flavus]|uniref:Transposase IS200-like domain-containing protein n=1 Tax=Phragmitibacter flavus TaxID=2576071 RepID=A0A5R8KD66_9BACT|nr:transposase [Phragmitibacter flavus]TLD70248.1 hypothetical protein FEM03_13770 [Phragmitibacter flavus]